MLGILPPLLGPLALLVTRDKLLQRTWRRFADQLELEFAPGPMMGSDQMEGTFNGHRVIITNELRRSTRVFLDTAGGLPPGIELSLKSWGFIRADESLLTGDVDFDWTIFATGSGADLLARLDPQTRAVVRDTITAPPGRFTSQIEVANGWIAYTTPGMLVKMKHLKCVILTLIRLADALRLDRPVQAALRENACSPLEAMPVRLNNLRALIEHFPESAETIDACRAAMRATSWSLRLNAARHLDHTREGINTLLSILRSSTAPPRVRIRALRHLIFLPGRLPPDEDVIAASRGPAPELRIATVDVLAFRRSEAAFERLLEMLRDPRFEVVERVAALLAEIPGSRSEHALLSLLAHDSIEVRRVAAHGLEFVGTVHAVEPLMASIRGVLTDVELKAIARRTITRIQGRLVGADAGHLSLAGHEGGALSVPSSEGAVSLKTD